MKKLIVLMVLIAVLLVPIYAQEDQGAWFEQDIIRKSGEDNLYEVKLFIREDESFCSAEFGLVLSEGVVIEELSLGDDVSSSKIGVTEKNGVYYFGFLDSSNKYSGTIEAFTLKFSSTEAISHVTINMATATRMTETGGAKKEELAVLNNLTLGAESTDENDGTEDDADGSDSNDGSQADGDGSDSNEGAENATDNSNENEAQLINDSLTPLDSQSAKLVLFDTLELSSEMITFEDIQTSWAKDEIETLARLDIIHGTSETTYEPYALITRADFVQILMGLVNLEAMSGADFDDVVPTDYYYDAVTTAKKAGVVKGIGLNNFEPNANITREDMMTIIARFLTLGGVTLEEEADLSQYVDADDISDYAVQSVSQLVAKGIIQGNDDLEINPKGNLTREEAARVVYMVYLELYVNK